MGEEEANDQREDDIQDGHRNPTDDKSKDEKHQESARKHTTSHRESFNLLELWFHLMKVNQSLIVAQVPIS